MWNIFYSTMDREIFVKCCESFYTSNFLLLWISHFSHFIKKCEPHPMNSQQYVYLIFYLGFPKKGLENPYYLTILLMDVNAECKLELWETKYLISLLQLCTDLRNHANIRS